MTPSKAPVEWANIVAALLSLLSLAVAMGWITVTGEQYHAVEAALGTIGVVLWPTLATLWARLQVTTYAEPKDVDGVPLVRESGEQPIKVQERAVAERSRA